MSLFEVFRLALVYRKRLLSATIFGSVIYILIYFFILPLSFTAAAAVYPPDAAKTGGLSSLLQGSDFGDLLGSGGGSNPSQLFAEVLRSRSATKIVLSKLPQLQKYFTGKTENVILSKISENLTVEVTKENLIKLSFVIKTGFAGRFGAEKDSIRGLIPLVINEYLFALDSLNRKKLNTRAFRSKEFFLDQILLAKASIDSAAHALNEFQKKNKAISLPEQVRSTIDAGAKIRAEILSTEISLQLAEQNFKQDTRTVESLRSKLDALKNQLQAIELNGDDYLLSFGSVPVLSIQFANMTRDLKMLNELYLLLHQQYYKEQLQSNRKITTIEILDPAITPDRETYPKTLNIFLAVPVIFLISLTIIVLSQKQLFQFKK